MQQPVSPSQSAHLFEAESIRVTSGVNLGDQIELPELCLAGDIYELERNAQPLRLMLYSGPGPHQAIAEGSEIGQEGERIDLVARHVMMTPEGDTVDLLMLRHAESGRLYVLPLSPIAPRIDYTLVSSTDDPGEARLSDLICVAFTTGTLITMAGGTQQPIESLKPGDRVLTRDSGPQAVRLVTRATMRALGSFAPVVISAGTLGNEGDLVMSPHHRIFLYRRAESRIGATAEMLVQARWLIDGEHVWRREGGYVDYYALVFDHHEIIYAEGIPVESLMVNEATLTLMPRELTAEIRSRLPGLHHAPHIGTEAGRDVLARVGSDKLFRSSSLERGGPSRAGGSKAGLHNTGVHRAGEDTAAGGRGGAGRAGAKSGGTSGAALGHDTSPPKRRKPEDPSDGSAADTTGPETT